MTNALLNCLSDTSVYVNRFSLDFIISHLPINNSPCPLEMNVTLVEAVLYLITKKDFACLKKFSTWLLSHLDDEEDDVDYSAIPEDPAILAIIPALQRIFSTRPENERDSIKPL